MKRVLLNKISKKRKSQLAEYYLLVASLKELAHNKSELSGKEPDWQSDFIIDPHHIDGRENNRLIDPFNIILLTRCEHDIEEGKIKGGKHTKQELLDIVRPIRIKQGFKTNP